MEFKKYEDMKEFVEDNMELLLEKEWLNNLMIGNCNDGLKCDTKNWILATITQNKKTELIMLSREPWHLLFYSPTNNKSEELFKFAAEEIYKIKKHLLGVNGEKECANKFAKHYCKIANLKCEIQTPLRILLLEKLNKAEINNPEIIFRRANIEDKPTNIQYMKEFYEVALHESITAEELEEKYKRCFKRGLFVLEKNGKIVAQAELSRDLINGECVGGVYTPKEERCKGYAYELVYKISEQTLQNGAKFCVLFTDAKNPISNHVYEKIGYVRQVDCEDLKFVK